MTPSPLLAPPLPGYIMPSGSSWSGGTFGVTSTLAQHIASGRASGTDMARYPRAAGDPVYCMRNGVVYQKYVQPMHNPPQIGDGALIVRVRHAEGNTGYAHLQSFASGIYVGAPVKQGQLIGRVGYSGTTQNSPHLHTHWQDNAGVHHEVYNQLEQSRNLQYNAGVAGVRIRGYAGLTGPIKATVTANGIIRADGKKIAERSAILTRLRVVHVLKDGYWWEPISVGGLEGWTARNFIHFV